jgi:hypothetical protein
MVAQPAFPGLGSNAAPIGRRAAARVRLAVPARFVSIYSTQNCILIDLSCSGARIGLAQPLPEDQTGYLEVARLQLFGEIVRTEFGIGGGTNALAFEEPVPTDQVIAIRRFAENFEARERLKLRDQVRRWVTGEK